MQGNLGWAYMQQSNFLAAEAVYRKALSIGPDNNKVCNLGICLMKQGRMEEAKAMLQSVVPACPDTRWGSDSHLKSYERAQEMLVELEASMGRSSAMPSGSLASNNLLQSALWQPQQSSAAVSQQSQRSSDPLSDFALPFSGALSATAGFGPTVPSRPAHKKTASVLGQQQQQQQQPQQLQRSLSYDIGRANEQFMGYQSSSFNAAAGWDDYEPGYTSPDENVDTNVQGAGNNNDNQGLSASSHFQQQQQQMHWPGEALRNKQDSFSAALLASNNNNEKQPLGDRKLERSLTFGGALLKDNNAYNTAMGSYAYPPAQMQRESHHQRTASESFSGKISSFASPTKPTGLGERIESSPLTQERPSLVNLYNNKQASSADENAASNHITSGWGKTAGPPMKSPLGNSELSFFSRWGYNDNSRPAVRRSLSLESFDTQLEQIALENEEAGEVALPPVQPKRPRNQTPVKENNNNSSLWNSLGFSFSPDGAGAQGHYAQSEDMKRLSNMVSYVVSEGAAAAGAPQAQSEHVHSGVLSARLGAAEVEAPASSMAAAGDAEMIKRQRRLRVFQEITLFPGSPQHVV